ncbi:MAG: 3-deoxy-D-manno-octulosonic acid transferase [Rhodobacter sp.]|nr:3-deoxy-D-manno-octulosonic acid transferase [Rhodobacter sp.]
MSRSLGLALYALFAGRGTGPAVDWPPRPAGRLIWMHAPGPGTVPGLLELARRLREEDGHSILMTSAEEVPGQAGLTRILPPAETEAAVRAFLQYWRPGIGVLSDGELRPLLLDEAARRSIPVIMVDARKPGLPGGPGPFWPGVIRHGLGQLNRVFAVDETAARLFCRKGADPDLVRIEGRMEDGSVVLPCTEAERAALVRQFRTRPVWLATGLPEAEDAAVIGAHRAALRLAHRLLLIVVPDRPERADALARQIEAAEGWTVARRSADEEPDEETEVFLADVPSEMGLWYRLAPITYLGGSLYGAGSPFDPFEAAALGSAILHGPQTGEWQAAMARLTEARATRPVSSPVDLAEGLADLLSPDRAARLAQAAWAVTSAGAEVTDRVVLLVRALMEADR